MAIRLSALALAALAGCGGLSYTVDRDVLHDVAVEYKLVLFDAENDVSIALDERENIRRQIQQAKQDVADAEGKVLEADQDEERANLKGDTAAADVARMAHDVYELKIDFLGDRLELLRERLAAQEGLIYVAWAKFELAKAKLIKKNNVRGAADIDLVDFEEQVDKYVERAKDDRAALDEVEKAVQAAEQEWLAQREKLQAASGGGQGSSWAEDSAAWGY